jgi:hypothetical protein
MAAAILPKAEKQTSRPTGDKPVRAAFVGSRTIEGVAHEARESAGTFG